LVDQIKNNEMGRAWNTYGERRCAYRVLVLRPDGERAIGRPRNRWEDNIKMELKQNDRTWTTLLEGSHIASARLSDRRSLKIKTLKSSICCLNQGAEEF
jgi:hypothetical protein